jgi:hypothetical protein
VGAHRKDAMCATAYCANEFRIPAGGDCDRSLLFAYAASPNSERRFAPGVIITEKVLYGCRLLLCTKLAFQSSPVAD